MEPLSAYHDVTLEGPGFKKNSIPDPAASMFNISAVRTKRTKHGDRTLERNGNRMNLNLLL